MKSKLYQVVLCIIMLSCTKEELILDKICGTWKIDETQEFEQWRKDNMGFKSRMFSVNGKDTLVSEFVSVFLKDGKWNFQTFVKNQNSGSAVTFVQSNLSSSSVRFENQTHDFPKVIQYELVSSTILHAFIAGNGDTIRFNFARIK